MARIAGVDIPNDKRVVVSLTYIYGIGRTVASNILKNVNISENERIPFNTILTKRDFFFKIRIQN